MSPGSFTRRSMQLNGIAALRFGVSVMSASVAEAEGDSDRTREAEAGAESEGAEGGGQKRPAVEGGGRQ
jgi:hypothetical protein